MTTPRCFIARHGETEWSISGKHTGTTDIPLTPNGEKRVRATGRALIGDDRLIVPKHLKHMYVFFSPGQHHLLRTPPNKIQLTSYVSPRTRAQRTLELLDIGCHDPYPWQTSSSSHDQHINTHPSRKTDARITITPDIAEWNYGDYEGITSAEIRARRQKEAEERGEDGEKAKKWDIWVDGCPGGESPEDVVERVDRLIKEIRDKYHGPVMAPRADHKQRQMNGDSGKEKEKEMDEHGDVLVVAHGHILRAFAMRWIGQPLASTSFIMEAGGVGTLSYEHHSVEEPAVLLGGGFVVEE